MVTTSTDRVYGESSGVAVKAPVRAVSQGANLPLVGLLTLGGVALEEGDRVLVKDQSNPVYNGIYNASASAWARAGDFAGAFNIVSGTLVAVSTAVGALYQITTPDPISIGQSPINFAEVVLPGQPSVPTAAEIAGGVVPTSYVYDPGDLRRYGADPTGVLPADAAWASALAQASQNGGADIYAPGTYLLNAGIVISANGIRVRGSGMGPTTLRAGANGIALLKCAGSWCYFDALVLDANGHASVDGLVLAPVNESDLAHTTFNHMNVFTSVRCFNGLQNGIRMRAGPSVAGVDSGVFYNTFHAVWIQDCIRGVWMQDSVNAGFGAPNRNNFFGVRCYSYGVTSNTGLQIDSGSTNVFFGFHCEGIANGVSPNATPTAVKIANTGANGQNNDSNHFFGCVMESNTRDLDNANALTHIYGGDWRAAKFGGGGVSPRVFFGSDPGYAPVTIPGLQYGEGLAGYPSGYWGMTKEIADSGKQWQPYTLSIANVTNVASVASALSHYRQLSSMVSWVANFSFNASVGGTQITIAPPVPPNAAQYSTLAAANAFYTFTVADGTGTNKVVEAGWTNTGLLYVKAPAAGWNTGGNNNAIWLQVDYHV